GTFAPEVRQEGQRRRGDVGGEPEVHQRPVCQVADPVDQVGPGPDRAAVCMLDDGRAPAGSAYIVAVLSLAHRRLDRGLGEERARRRLYLRRLLLGGAGDPAAQRRLTSYVASPGGVMVIAVRDVPDGDLAEAAQLVHET